MGDVLHWRCCPFGTAGRELYAEAVPPAGLLLKKGGCCFMSPFEIIMIVIAFMDCLLMVLIAWISSLKN